MFKLCYLVKICTYTFFDLVGLCNLYQLFVRFDTLQCEYFYVLLPIKHNNGFVGMDEIDGKEITVTIRDFSVKWFMWVYIQYFYTNLA